MEDTMAKKKQKKSKKFPLKRNLKKKKPELECEKAIYCMNYSSDIEPPLDPQIGDPAEGID
jgi:hypothetical protein